MDKQTAVQRIILETHKENPDDTTNATISLIKAIGFYSPHRFFFNEKWDDSLTLDTGVSSYPRADLFSDLERIDSIWVKRNDRWRWIEALHTDEFIARLGPVGTPNNEPRRWTWFEDSLHVDPIPNDDYEIRVLYVRETDVPVAAWTGSVWEYTKPAGGTWLDSDSCEMLENAPELMIARAKWDLYFNIYDDNENAQKMQILVDIEYSRLAKRLSNLKSHMRRVPVRV